ncbi:MAG: cytidylyltransferase domain-containing protein [Anaerolineales bacterium]
MITAIVQARLGSRRLPEKVLQEVAGQPLIGHVIQRVRAAQKVERVILATTDQPADDRLVEWAESQAIPVFRGSENDVLCRYVEAAQAFDASVVVRITGDCPLLDPQVIDATIGLFQSADYAYVNNFMPRTYPDGLDTEVIRLEALQAAHQAATLPSDREHVTPFIRKHPGRFPQVGLTYPKDLSMYRWTVDEPADLAFVTRIFQALYPRDPLFDMKAIIGLLARQPELLHINQGIPTNEGYAVSLAKDAEEQKSFFEEINFFTHEALIPLTAVRGYTDLLLRALDGGLTLSEDEQREFLHIIKTGGNTLAAYILNMSELVRFERAPGAEFAAVSPAEVVNDAAEKLRKRAAAERRPLDIQDKTPLDIPLIWADRERIHRVLQRLTDNAYLYTPPAGRVTLSAYHVPEARAVCFRVDDTGPGIDPDDRDAVFVRYKRGGDHQHITGTPGSGMGLSIAKLYTESMGGRIWFTSQPGAGSSFFVQIPQHQPNV